MFIQALKSAAIGTCKKWSLRSTNGGACIDSWRRGLTPPGRRFALAAGLLIYLHKRMIL